MCSQINMVTIKRLGIAGSCAFSLGLISYCWTFPAMLKWQVKMVSKDWYIGVLNLISCVWNIEIKQER